VRSPHPSWVPDVINDVRAAPALRVDKATVLQALQSRGESYDRARETLRYVSVDVSGKVELEDWVEVCRSPCVDFALL